MTGQPESMGSRLARARKLAGMTQRELSEAVGVDRTSVARYERGRNAPGAAHIRLLCVALGVSADWLLGGRD